MIYMCSLSLLRKEQNCYDDIISVIATHNCSRVSSVRMMKELCRYQVCLNTLRS